MTPKIRYAAILGWIASCCLGVSLARAGTIGFAAAHVSSVGTSNATAVDTILSQTPGVNLVTINGNLGDIRIAGGGGADPLLQATGVVIANATTIACCGFDVDTRAFIEVPGDLTGPNAFTPGLWFSTTTIAGGGGEQTFDFSFAHFPFADGWIGGHVNATGTILGGNIADVTVTVPLGPAPDPLDPDIPLVGRRTLTIGGVNPTTDGILFAIGAKNDSSGNTVPIGILDDNSGWDLRVNDQGQNFSMTGENAPFSFVYVPYAAQNLIAGRIDDNGNVLNTNAAGAFTVTKPTGVAGEYLLDIGGKTIDDGILLLQVTELVTTAAGRAPEDNFMVYEYRADLGGFLVASHDLAGAANQNVTWTFAFIEYDKPLSPNVIPEPSTCVLLLMGLLGMTGFARRRRGRGEG